MAIHTGWYIMKCCYYLEAGGLARSLQGHRQPITACICLYTPALFCQVKLSYLNEISLLLIFSLMLSDFPSPQVSARNVRLCSITQMPTLAESSPEIYLNGIFYCMYLKMDSRLFWVCDFFMLVFSIKFDNFLDKTLP